jgi:hypothetical protein
MSGVGWYWHRLRAMSPAELARHTYKKAFPTKPPKRQVSLELPTQPPSSVFIKPSSTASRIAAGDWRAFQKLPIKVDDPPRWNYDYLAGVEVPNCKRFDHRVLPNGADIKLIWELSRWYELVRLAKGGAAKKCLEWLEDWVKKNPPYQGLNWISALESGIRLIHFWYIDVIVGGVGDLGQKVLPAHVWFTWRERSFGSSANNHLLGELAGLIVACVNWPQLTSLCAPLDQLHREWEREVLAQFAEDGGNREQALNYHAFSLYLCQETRAALVSAGKKISPVVEERLKLATEFYDLVQVPGERWDYGDADDAVERVTERFPEEDRWHYWPDSGIARYRSGEWDLRWDVSPLGYLGTAAHGHLDALHLSIWWKGMAVVIDPGTGAYYGDPKLRAALAGWDAHNGPHLPGQDYPKRLGVFLWSEHHAKPTWKDGHAEFKTPQGMFSRAISKLANGWQVEDRLEPHQPFIVRWQFAPGAELGQKPEKGSWRLKRQDGCFDIQVSGGDGEMGNALVSPGFRQTAQAPFLELKTGSEACVLRTKILIC